MIRFLTHHVVFVLAISSMGCGTRNYPLYDGRNDFDEWCERLMKKHLGSSVIRDIKGPLPKHAAQVWRMAHDADLPRLDPGDWPKILPTVVGSPLAIRRCYGIRGDPLAPDWVLYRFECEFLHDKHVLSSGTLAETIRDYCQRNWQLEKTKVTYVNQTVAIGGDAVGLVWQKDQPFLLYVAGDTGFTSFLVRVSGQGRRFTVVVIFGADI